MTKATDFTPALTIFVLIKTKISWLALSPDERFAELGPILTKELGERRDSLRMKFYDTEFYNTDCSNRLARRERRRRSSARTDRLDRLVPARQEATRSGSSHARRH